MGTFTIDPAASLNGSAHIPVGARVHFYTTAGVAHATGASVTTVTANNTTTGVVTCDSVPTDAVVGDIVVYENSYGNCMNGLRGLVQNSNITFQNVDVTSQPGLKANIVDASSASWSQPMVDRVLTRTKIAGGVNRPVNEFVIITHPKQSDAVRNAGYALNSITTGSDRAANKLDLGFPLISTNGMRIREDVDCGQNEMWGLRLSSFERYALFEPGLLEIIPGSMLAPKPGSRCAGTGQQVPCGRPNCGCSKTTGEASSPCRSTATAWLGRKRSAVIMMCGRSMPSILRRLWRCPVTLPSSPSTCGSERQP